MDVEVKKGNKLAEKPATKEQVSSLGLTWANFVLFAIRVGAELASERTGKEQKGIHLVYSGFRQDAMNEFGLSAEQLIGKLNSILVNPTRPVPGPDGKVVWEPLPTNPAGVIEQRPAKGGIMLYRAGEAGAQRTNLHAAMVAKMAAEAQQQ